MNFTPKEILNLDESIRYAGTMDSDGNGLTYLIRKDLADVSEEEIWRYDTVIALQIAELQTPIFGKLLCIQTSREKVNQLIFYDDKKIIYITFDSHPSNLENIRISCLIQKHMKNSMIKLEV